MQVIRFSLSLCMSTLYKDEKKNYHSAIGSLGVSVYACTLTDCTFNSGSKNMFPGTLGLYHIVVLGNI